MQKPSVVHANFGALTKHPPQKPIYILEAGCPTGKKNRCSEALQAQFIHKLFAAWGSHVGRIPVIE